VLNFECLIFNAHWTMKHSKLRISWYTNFGILSTSPISCVTSDSNSLLISIHWVAENR